MGNGHPSFFGWVNPPPALAGVLIAGLGKPDDPATKRLSTEWTRQSGSTTPSRGFPCILVVPRW